MGEVMQKVMYKQTNYRATFPTNSSVRLSNRTVANLQLLHHTEHVTGHFNKAVRTAAISTDVSKAHDTVCNTGLHRNFTQLGYRTACSVFSNRALPAGSSGLNWTAIFQTGNWYWQASPKAQFWPHYCTMYVHQIYLEDRGCKYHNLQTI